MTTACDLFERKGLLQIERGVPLDPHFETCPDCLEARRRYALLTRTLGQLEADAEPSPSWQTGVWAGIRVQHAPRSRRWAWWLAPVAAVAAVVLFVVWPHSASPPPASLAVEILAGQVIVRGGGEAHPGDQLRLRASTGGFAFAEVRVYFNDGEVSMRCSTDLPCRRTGDELSAVTTMTSLGTYRAVLIASANPIPAPAGTLDADAGAALRSGAVVQAGDPIPVR